MYEKRKTKVDCVAEIYYSAASATGPYTFSDPLCTRAQASVDRSFHSAQARGVDRILRGLGCAGAFLPPGPSGLYRHNPF